METKNNGDAFQRLKYWIDLGKWFVVSVALVIMTTIIDWGFKDRQAGLAELKFYDNYVTELIVLNPSPVQKRMLAQYFACVTPSEKLRTQWKIYHDSIYQEYIDYITPLIEEEALLLSRYETLSHALDATGKQQQELVTIEARLEEIRQALYPTMKLPETEVPEQ